MWTPRSLKLDSRDSEEIRSMGDIRAGSSGVPISLELYTTLQTAGSTGLFGVRKMMYLVLEAFSDILLDLNQLAIFCNSQFTYAITSARTGPLAKPVVSSENKAENIDVHLQKSCSRRPLPSLSGSVRFVLKQCNPSRECYTRI